MGFYLALQPERMQVVKWRQSTGLRNDWQWHIKSIRTYLLYQLSLLGVPNRTRACTAGKMSPQ
jgi:hypothetical protein